MSRRDDLEGTVIEAGAWNLDQLAVYADELQLHGDPRGELIALDLQVAAGGSSPELAERRRGLLAGLLGDLATDPAIHCRYGYVDLELDDTRNVDLVSRLGPLARYLRGVRLVAGAASIATLVDVLAITPRPWLTSLSLRHRGGLGPSPVVRSKSSAALAAAAPRLDTLEVSGNGVLASFAHPALRVLRLDGVDAVLSLTNAAELLPAVAELDLRFGATQRRRDEEWARYLPPIQLPALRRLDLERNDPAADAVYPSFIDVFRFLRMAAIAPQLTHLRLPLLRSAGDLANAQAALDRMDRLALVEAPPSEQLSALHHRGAAIRELRRSWRPLARTMATFVVDDVSFGVQLADAVTWLEDHYDRMPGEAREAWDHIWEVLLRQPRGRGSSRALFAELLVRALAACHGWVWPDLHRALQARDHGPGAMIRLA